jgi:carbonic anhydrase
MELDLGKYRSSMRECASRRQFMKTALVGGGAALAIAFWPGTLLAAGHADALLLSCMDYRLVEKTESYMAGRGLRDKYDHIVLAGAALGAVTEKYPEWNKTFWDELGLAIDLHMVHKVIVLDHRDCGAYKQILGEDLAKDPRRETEVHAAELKKLRGLVEKKYRGHEPRLETELLLMALDGKVEVIS